MFNEFDQFLKKKDKIVTWSKPQKQKAMDEIDDYYDKIKFYKYPTQSFIKQDLPIQQLKKGECLPFLVRKEKLLQIHIKKFLQKKI